ncbi:hypothetical protein KOW79_007731 [Hemibagrus wyckioides]|uniref:Uncharacterized protein n=1 Tax=Hemibagrus wyckioides TaxID=337641 RepID=A0A9D3SMH0_9TELE|nr:hypothetical protein KOW79_007731 [Hemibagrus wyckioides]
MDSEENRSILCVCSGRFRYCPCPPFPLPVRLHWPPLMGLMGPGVLSAAEEMSFAVDIYHHHRRHVLRIGRRKSGLAWDLSREARRIEEKYSPLRCDQHRNWDLMLLCGNHHERWKETPMLHRRGRPFACPSRSIGSFQ